MCRESETGLVPGTHSTEHSEKVFNGAVLDALFLSSFSFIMIGVILLVVLLFLSCLSRFIKMCFTVINSYDIMLMAFVFGRIYKAAHL